MSSNPHNAAAARGLIDVTTLPGGTYRLTMHQWLEPSQQDLWPFFSNAANLEEITPDSVQFHVITPQPVDMHPGTLIDYRLKVRGLPLRWRTHISDWNPPTSFIDQQVRGPYDLWHHEHRFVADGSGTRCTDTVHYRVPGGPLAPLIHAMFVGPDVRKIFAHRAVVLADRFASGRVLASSPDTSTQAKAERSAALDNGHAPSNMQPA
ncbi:MAG: SRPBCC family protein [Planctomycetota bacterium]